MPPQNPTSTNPPQNPQQIAEARLALEASMNNIGASFDSTLKSRATNLHSNSAALSKQQDSLIKEVGNLKKENDKLGKVARDMGRQLKEVGDVQNWAEMLERDFLVVEETLRRVREGSEGSWSSGSGSYWSGSESGDDGGGPADNLKRGDDGDVEMGGMDAHDSDLKNGNRSNGKGKELANGFDQTNGSAITHTTSVPEHDSSTPTT